jgi:hypothetical protein
MQHSSLGRLPGHGPNRQRYSLSSRELPLCLAQGVPAPTLGFARGHSPLAGTRGKPLGLQLPGAPVPIRDRCGFPISPRQPWNPVSPLHKIAFLYLPQPRSQRLLPLSLTYQHSSSGHMSVAARPGVRPALPMVFHWNGRPEPAPSPVPTRNVVQQCPAPIYLAHSIACLRRRRDKRPATKGVLGVGQHGLLLRGCLFDLFLPPLDHPGELSLFAFLHDNILEPSRQPESVP